MADGNPDGTKRDLVVTRVFDAPVEQVWHAWTDPEHVMSWWGPTGFTSPIARMDFREGGTSLVCMRSPERHDLYNTWTYREILPMRRIEFVQRFSDEDGNTIDPATMGMPPGIPRDVPHVVTFEAVDDDRTEMTVTEYGYTSDQIVEVSRAGLEQCLEKMAASFAGRCGMPAGPSAERFVEALEAHRSPDELEKVRRYFKSGKGQYGEGDVFMGVRMGRVFELAREFIEMPPEEIERLLENPIHEVRAGALSIMDKQARRKKTPESRRKELFDLYLRRTDRINNWDLVDVGCPYVVGGYLFDKPRDVLYELARSESLWERRTAIVSTSYFIRKGDVADTFKIAEILLDDDEDLIHKATGGWLREAGKKDLRRLLGFLDRYAAAMPRTALRYAIERLDKDKRDYYMSMKKSRGERP